MRMAARMTSGIANNAEVEYNFKHINNPFMKQQIRAVINDQGYAMPEICSPEELLEATQE